MSGLSLDGELKLVTGEGQGFGAVIPTEETSWP